MSCVAAELPDGQGDVRVWATSFSTGLHGLGKYRRLLLHGCGCQHKNRDEGRIRGKQALEQSY